jgi:hypothetical protein
VVEGSVARREPVPVGPGGQVRLSGSGLVLPRQLSFERWVGIGRQLSAVCSSSAWCLGDWLVFGQAAFAGRYREAVVQTSLDYQTLRNYAWVAGRFAVSRRRDSLSFGHHAEVAALPEPEQDFWLRKAEEHRWPVKQLRRQVRASLAERSADRADPGLGQPDWVTLRLQVRISAGQLKSCQEAANQASLTIEDWMVQALEHAVLHQLAYAELQSARYRKRIPEHAGLADSAAPHPAVCSAGGLV